MKKITPYLLFVMLQLSIFGEDDFFDQKMIEQQQNRAAADHLKILKKITTSKYIKLNFTDTHHKNLLTITSNAFISSILDEMSKSKITHLRGSAKIKSPL